MDAPDRILIIKLSAIGDVVHTLPALEVLKSNFPKAQIDWVVEENASEIIRGHPALRQMIVSKRRQWMKGLIKNGARKAALRETFQFLKTLRTWKYDWVLDFQGLLKSGIICGLSKGKRKMGLAGAREGGDLFWSERPVPVNYDQHAIDRYLCLIDSLGCERSEWKGSIPVFESDKNEIRDFLKDQVQNHAPLAAINPMAKWRTKLWDPLRFARLADTLAREIPCRVVFTGSKNDKPDIEQIIQRMETMPMNLTGKTTLKELAYLYSKCDVVVSTDTGPMHIAAASGCPVVALFGPTAPRRTGPYGTGHQIIRSNMHCSPCFDKTCDHTSCMKDIDVESVFTAVKKALNSR